VSNVFFISDPHLGHVGYKKFCPWIIDLEHEDYIEILKVRWNSVVKRGDIIWVLGDVAKNKASLIHMKDFNGTKHLVRGNHDTLESMSYLLFFNSIHGIVKKYGFWISHCPIHPQELRGFKNIHGHVHQKLVLDSNYIYVGADKLEGYPISLEELKRF